MGATTEGVAFATGEKITDEIHSKYRDDFDNSRIVESGVSGESDHYCCIAPFFIQYYYHETKFPGSLVYTEGCEGLVDNTMANNFTSIGAEAYIGYSTTIIQDLPLWWWSGDYQAQQAFYNFVYNGYTVEQVVNDLHRWYDPFNPITWFGNKNYKLVETAIAPKGSLVIIIHSPANLHVIDPIGRHIGFEPTTQQIVNEIPDAIYSGPEIEPQIIVIPSSLLGVYCIDIVGTDTGLYTISVKSIAIDGSIEDAETWTGTTSQGETTRIVAQLFENGDIIQPVFNVVPEVPFGTIVFSATMIIALAVFAMPRLRRKKEYLTK